MGDCYQKAVKLAKEPRDRRRGHGRRKWRAVPACLHHPPNRKVMHEPTDQKCSGESASSHLESIRCPNQPAEQVSAGGRQQLSFPASQVPARLLSPGCFRHWGPYFSVHYAGSPPLSHPHSTLAAEEWSALHQGFSAKKCLWAIFLRVFF